MAEAHANLTTCVKSIVHGVSDSEKYLAISKMVQSATTDDSATLVASQLRIINIKYRFGSPGYMDSHIFDDRSFTSLVSGFKVMDSVAKSP